MIFFFFLILFIGPQQRVRLATKSFIFTLPPFRFYLFFRRLYHFNTSHLSEVYDVTSLRHHYISCNSLLKKKKELKNVSKNGKKEVVRARQDSVPPHAGLDRPLVDRNLVNTTC